MGQKLLRKTKQKGEILCQVYKFGQCWEDVLRSGGTKPYP